MSRVAPPTRSDRVNCQFLLHISSSWATLSSHTKFQLPTLYKIDLTIFELSRPPNPSNRVNYQFLLHISASWATLSSHTKFHLPMLYKIDLTLILVELPPAPHPLLRYGSLSIFTLYLL